MSAVRARVGESTSHSHWLSRNFPLLLYLVRLLFAAGAVSGVKVAKVRLDELLVSRGVAESPHVARGLVLAGDVFLNESQRLTSPAAKLPEDAVLRVKQRKGHPFASRGGVKLDHAVKYFGLEGDIRDSVAIDVGCSTGGFTDVLLQAGARRVYAVDVGYNLLDFRLRNDDRVVVLERTNARHLSGDLVPDAPVGVVVCDASFISLETILPAAMDLTAPNSILICLIKPQFEAKKDEIMPGGLISSPQVHARVQEEAVAWLNSQPSWTCEGVVESPIRGAESGNIEFLMLGRKKGSIA